MKPDAGALGVIRDIVEDRVNTTVSEPVVQTQGADRSSSSSRRDQPRRDPPARGPDGTPRLRAPRVDADDRGPGHRLEQFPPLFPGSEVSTATIGQDQTGGLTVNFQLKDNGAKLFGDYTRDHIGEYFAIVLDGKVVSAPSINSSIPGGQVQIEAGGVGGFPVNEANNLVTVLKFGSLPFPIVELSSEQISATLGERFLNQSLLAARSASGSSCCSCSSTTACLAWSRASRPLLRDRGPRNLPAHPGDADPCRHRRLRALDRHGGGRQHPDLRTDEGGAGPARPCRPPWRPASTGPGTRSSTRTCRASSPRRSCTCSGRRRSAGSRSS